MNKIWQEVEREISFGHPLDRVASHFNIAENDIILFFEKRYKRATGLNIELKLISEGALACAIEVLTKAAKAGPRECAEGPGGSKLYNTDIESAKALSAIAIDILKLIGVDGWVVKEDPIDRSKVIDMGPWKLKNPTA